MINSEILEHIQEKIYSSKNSMKNIRATVLNGIFSHNQDYPFIVSVSCDYPEANILSGISFLDIHYKNKCSAVRLKELINNHKFID